VIFVDDVARSEPAHILIETAPGTYQAHYLLSRVVSRAEAAVIHKQLVEAKGEISVPEELRRFPEGRFMHDTWRELLDVDLMLSGREIEID
jgi:hypothetical protein